MIINYRILLPVLLFVVLAVHSATIGLSDDEAYYWVLAQNPGFGFAYHPPGVVWGIALFQKLFHWLLGSNLSLLARLPAIFFSAAILFLSFYWIDDVVGQKKNMAKPGLILIAYAGVFASSWMIVPDLPLLFGWMIMFLATWQIAVKRNASPSWCFWLVVGTSISLLSKYSAVLAVFSSFIAIFLWGSKRERSRGVAALLAGMVIAAVPIIIWNATHNWASILYQIQGRHSGSSFSILRFFKFFGSQLLFAGPVLLFYSFTLIPRTFFKSSPDYQKFAGVWLFPPAIVFCIQPLFADFKPHWALVAWLPAAMAFAVQFHCSLSKWWVKAHVGYGFLLGSLGLIMCHLPLNAWFTQSLLKKNFDPRWDVTNDMYGWEEVGKYFRGTDLPVIGSRYQTSSQLAFAISDVSKVSYIPRDEKQIDEWPDLNVTENQGPHWSRLLKSVYFVADNRYSAPPSFIGASCRQLTRLEKRRSGYLAKWFDIWKCEPKKEGTTLIDQS